MVLLIKKDFFPGEVCPLHFSEKYRFSKSKLVHRKVKCAHLVPEPGSRVRKKSTQRNSKTKMHRRMHRTDVVPELAGRRSINLVARSKKLKLSSPRADNALMSGIFLNSSNLVGWSTSPRAYSARWLVRLPDPRAGGLGDQSPSIQCSVVGAVPRSPS